MTTAYLFPGQGSQSAGMGAELFDDHPEIEASADRVLGYSVRQLCLHDTARLRRTEYAQPALYVVNAMAWLRLGGTPAFLAGHSLGEYSALFAAGCFDFETGLRLVKRRGELMAACPPGAMMAVLGLTREELTPMLTADIDLANHNTPEQLVVAGPPQALRELQDSIMHRQAGKGVLLNVSIAAHSRYMEQAARDFAAELGSVVFAEPRLPVIANATAKPYTAETAVDLLTSHLTQPVRWWETLCLLASAGVGRIVEVGPGEVLTRMWDKSRAYLPSAAPRACAPAPVPASAEQALGDRDLRQAYGVRMAYLAGAMGYGVSGPALLGSLSDDGLLGFLGTAGRTLSEIDDDMAALSGKRYGVNLPAGLADPDFLSALVDLAVRHGVGHAEAAAHAGVTGDLLRWRFGSGAPAGGRHLVVKVARAAQAAAFLRPAPAETVDRLRASGKLSEGEADAAAHLPVATAVCAESESGWLAGGDTGPSLLPAVIALRDELRAARGYQVWVGASGGLGCPAAVAGQFLAGADFVLTGSVNQCTTQARIADPVKELLSTIDVDDTSSAPAGDLFELGGRTRVASRRGILFPARAGALQRAFQERGGLDELDGDSRRRLESGYFGRPLQEVADQVAAGVADPRRRMALVFRSYFDTALRAALDGVLAQRANWQIPCGPAMGAFNRSVAGTSLADWRRRDAVAVAGHLMSGAARLLNGRSS